MANIFNGALDAHKALMIHPCLSHMDSEALQDLVSVAAISGRGSECAQKFRQVMFAIYSQL